MKLLHFGRRLTPSSIERVLQGESPTKKADRGWAKEVLTEGMFIDLSEVEFAEFSTLAQIALLVEGAVRHGVHVRLALPLTRPRKGESDFIRDNSESSDPVRQLLARATERRIVNRREALQFMDASGFRSAININHVPHVNDLLEIQRNYDSGVPPEKYGPAKSMDQSSDITDTSEEKREYLLRRIFSLRWFTPLYGHELAKSHQYATAVISLEEIGLTKLDARALAGTLLGELIENVNFYAEESNGNVSCRPYALVGAIVLENGYEIRPENYRPFLREFVRQWSDLSTPVVRLVVGDSGRGIVNVLEPHFSQINEAEIPAIERPLRGSEKVLFWSLNRWSTSEKEASLAKRGTRGLWRIDRFVRSYTGLITLRAEDAMVGIFHGIKRSIPLADPNRLRFIPGTFVDICLMPGTASPEGSGEVVEALRLPKFSIIRCTGSETEGLSNLDQSRLVKELATSTITNPKCVIAILKHFPLVSQTSLDYLSSLITVASDLANHGALVVICPTVTWKQIEASVESLDASLDARVRTKLSSSIDSYSDPILLVDALGEGRWFGGEAPLREILSQLLRAPGHTLLAENLNLGDVNISRQQLEQELRDQPEVVELFGSGIRARFSVVDVDNYVSIALRDLLLKAVDEAKSSAVWIGPFRTPTLELVSRWIDVEKLVEERAGSHIVAYALSRKLIAANIRAEEQDLTVVRIDTTAPDLARGLTTCLGIEDPIFSLQGGLGAFDKEEQVRVPRGKRVIICSDMILTGNTVRHAIAKLLRRGVEPVAISCIFDARRAKEPFISSLGKSVPLFSFAELDLAVDLPQNTSIKNIDPVLREPLDIDYPFPVDYDIPPPELLNWCRHNEKTIYLGHIERPVGRHFTNYLNAGQIIKSGGELKEEILGLFVQHIVDWCKKQTKQNGNPEQPIVIEIWHPAPDDFAGWIASAVSSMLQRGSIKISGVKGIPRAAFSGKWAFPNEVNPVDQNTHVVIVDWGSLTANTLQQMMRLAAEAGSSSIKAVVFLSQMPIEEEMALRRIKAMSSIARPSSIFKSDQKSVQVSLFGDEDVAPSFKRKRHEVIVPTEVVFLSSLSLGYYAAGSCPTCQLRDALIAESRHVPTESLKRHVERTYDLLRSREREDVFSRESGDLYGERVTSEDVVDVIEHRLTLQRALRSTKWRDKTQSALIDISKTEHLDKKVSWVRLLATELEWLTLPPLRFEELRKLVATIALDVCEAQQPLPNAIIRQSLIVLSIASIDQFLARTPSLFERRITDPEIINDVFYLIFSYLQKDQPNTSEILKKVQNSLIECAATLRSVSGGLHLEFEYSLTINSLLRIAEYLQIKTQTDNLTAKEAWKWLIQRYVGPMESHCEAIGSMMYVLLTVRGSGSSRHTPTKERWKTTMERWQSCQMFLAANVLPYMPNLRDVLMGEFYASTMARADFARLEALYETHSALASGMLSETEHISRYLYGFAEDPKSFQVQHKQTQCRREVQWWNDFFLDPGGQPDDVFRGEAWLLRTLRRCPCSLEVTVRAAIEEMRIGGYQFRPDLSALSGRSIEIFCDKELFKHAIKHIIENAAGSKHIENEDHAMHQPHMLFLISELSDSDDKLTLRILNDHTRSTGKIGRGFRTLNTLLEPFGGHLEGDPLMNSEWSYEAKLSVRRW